MVSSPKTAETDFTHRESRRVGLRPQLSHLTGLDQRKPAVCSWVGPPAYLSFQRVIWGAPGWSGPIFPAYSSLPHCGRKCRPEHIALCMRPHEDHVGKQMRTHQSALPSLHTTDDRHTHILGSFPTTYRPCSCRLSPAGSQTILGGDSASGQELKSLQPATALRPRQRNSGVVDANSSKHIPDN